MSGFADYKKEIMAAAHDERVRLALSRAIKSYRANINNALNRYPHTIKLAEEVKGIKEKAVGEMEKLARQAAEAIESNHGKAYIAKTADDALSIISGLVGRNKLIVKGKSMTGEEIGLREHLEENGNEVYETDLGEFIIQKLGSRPMHITSPAVHVPREDVARLFTKIMGQEFSPSDIEAMVAGARKWLREKFFQADIGISGARDFDARIQEFNFRSLERALASLAMHSELSAALLNLYRFYFPKSVMTVNQNDPKEIDLKTLPTLEVSPEVRGAILQAHKDKYLVPYETRLKRLLDIAAANNLQPVLLTQPVLYGNTMDEVTGVNLGNIQVTKEMNGEVAWEVLELYNGVTRKVGREAGVPVIDLAAALPKTSRYFYDLMHYTNAGAEQVGEITYRHLSPWLAKNYPGYRRAAP